MNPSVSASPRTTPFDDAAVDSMLGHSQPVGDPQMPVFSLHTTDDLIVPVEHEVEYADDVCSQGNGSLFRQGLPL